METGRSSHSGSGHYGMAVRHVLAGHGPVHGPLSDSTKHHKEKVEPEQETIQMTTQINRDKISVKPKSLMYLTSREILVCLFPHILANQRINLD